MYIYQLRMYIYIYNLCLFLHIYIYKIICVYIYHHWKTFASELVFICIYICHLYIYKYICQDYSQMLYIYITIHVCLYIFVSCFIVSEENKSSEQKQYPTSRIVFFSFRPTFKGLQMNVYIYMFICTHVYVHYITCFFVVFIFCVQEKAPTILLYIYKYNCF